MSHGDDLNLTWFFSIDNGKGIAVKHGALSSVQIWRIELRALLHTVNRGEKFFIKTVGGIFTLLGVPGVRDLDLPSCRRMVLDRFQTSSRALACEERLAIISA